MTTWLVNRTTDPLADFAVLGIGSSRTLLSSKIWPGMVAVRELAPVEIEISIVRFLGDVLLGEPHFNRFPDEMIHESVDFNVRCIRP